MPETPQGQQAATPSTVPPQRGSRPPGELGGHTVMPWEQGEAEGGQAPSHIPAGQDPTSTASGGSSKSVPPPAQGAGKDGLGQGAGATTVKAADGMMPPASQGVTGERPATVSGKPPAGSAGANQAKAGKARPPPPALEEAHPEGAEAASLPRQPRTVQPGDAPKDATAGAPPVTPTAGATHPKPSPAAVDAIAKVSAPTAARQPPAKEAAPSPMVPSTGQDAAKAASGAAVHPTNPAAQAVSGQHDPQEDALIAALDKHLAEMLARALHETVASAVRQVRAPTRPPAPAPVQPAKQT